MLQLIRNKAQGVFAWTVVLLIAVIFALLGLNNFFNGSNHEVVAAKVNGEKIYWSTVDQAFQNVYRQYASHPDFDPNSLDVTAIKQQIRHSIVLQTALLNYYHNNGYTVSNEQLKQVLQTIPAFKQEGKFSPELYYSFLKANGLSDVSYQANLKKEILLRQFQNSIFNSSYATDIETTQLINLLNQKRDFGYVIVPFDKFKNEVNITEEQVKEFYDNNKQKFMTPEKIKIEYVELTIDDVSKDIEVSEEELVKYYNSNLELYTSPELVKASHILISAPEGSDKEKSGEARSKAEEILSKIKLGENTFEELVKEFSEDKFSAESGGDLGWLGRGEIDPDFERVAFSLNKGDVDLVKTGFGYHIIKITDKKEKVTHSFDKVKSEIEDEYKKEQAEIILADKAEELANIAFEYSESLEPVVHAMHLTIKESDYFSKEGSKTGIASIDKVVDNAFSDEILVDDKNSNLIKLNDDHFIIFRKKDFQESKQKELSEVKEEIKAELIKIASKKIASEKASQIQKLISAGNNPNSVIEKYKLDWKVLKNIPRGYESLDYKIISKVFSLPRLSEENKESVASIELPDGNYAVIALSKVHEGELDTSKDPKTTAADLENAYKGHIAVTFGRYEYNLFQDFVINNTKIKLNKIPKVVNGRY